MKDLRERKYVQIVEKLILQKIRFDDNLLIPEQKYV